MKKCVYLYVNEGETVQELLREQGFEVLTGDGTLNEEMLARCGTLVPGGLSVTKEILEKAPNLKFICKFGVGMNRIDIPACTEHGVCVTNTATTNRISVAEHTIALMLAVAKQIYRAPQYLQQRYPYWEFKSRYRSVEMHGKTLALIGLGNIGRHVAKIANGFDMKIIGFDPYVDRSTLPDYIDFVDSKEEALRRGDFISIHVAGVESNRNLIGVKEFAMMKSSAIFINTTRGFIVDEKALNDALHNKIIAGAGIDVVCDEPLKPDNPLLSRKNLVATPHWAANTPDARQRAEIQCAQNILDYYAGKRPQFALNNIPKLDN